MDNHIIDIHATILQALEQLNALTDGVMTLIVTDREGHVSGTVTDGDIRRALLGGATLQTPVEEGAHKDFSSVGTDTPVDRIKQARLKGIRLLPVIDNAGKLVDTLDLTKVETILPLSAILMAGGKGERLRPLTLTTPKPLLEIDGMPIIDYNVRNLSRAGITDVTVTTRYLASQIIDHFSKPVFGIDVKCVVEENPLGTIGAASLISLNERGLSERHHLIEELARAPQTVVVTGIRHCLAAVISPAVRGVYLGINLGRQSVKQRFGRRVILTGGKFGDLPQHHLQRVSVDLGLGQPKAYHSVDSALAVTGFQRRLQIGGGSLLHLAGESEIRLGTVSEKWIQQHDRKYE